MASSAHHVREHRSILADREKRLLQWMARRMPAAIGSDHLTLLALIAMIGAAAAFAAVQVTPYAAAGVIAALALNWLGDSLDGTLARVRRHERPRYGYYVDHVVDLAGTTILIVGMASSGRMQPVIAASVLVGYLLVSAESYLATHAAGIFRISFGGMGPTELRIVLAIGAVFMVRQKAPVAIGPLPPLWLFDVGGLVASAGLIAVFVWSSVRNTRALFRAEPLQTGVNSAPRP